MQPIIVDLTPYYGIIQVSGPDAFSFLQGQLTCHMQDIDEAHIRFAAFCTPKGRIRAIFRLFRKNDTFYLQLPKSLLTTTLSELKKYSLFSNVHMTDESEYWTILGIADTASLFSRPTPDAGASTSTILNLHEFIQQTMSFSEQSALLKILDSESHLEFITPNSGKLNALQDLEQKTTLADFNDWKLLDIRLGYPEIWPESSKLFLPHSLNLPALKAVSFNKGCYCGQEIIARMHYLGNLKRHMLHLRLDNFHDPLPIPSHQLLDKQGNELGTVITAAFAGDAAIELLIEAQSH